MELSMASLVDSTRIEKIVLAKKVGQFLAADQADVERRTVENVARVLAQDISAQVRGVLAFELRRCDHISRDLANKIATDIEEVSGPFLQATQAFDEETFEKLIPELEDTVRAWIARREDLSDVLISALVTSGGEASMAALLRNDMIELPDTACSRIIDKFGSNRRLMDHMGARKDLNLVIAERIIEKVSDHFKRLLVDHYLLDDTTASRISKASAYDVMWQQIKNSTSAQIHAFVTDLKVNRRLTHQTIIEMARRGSMKFMESALALLTGKSVNSVKITLSLCQPADFVKLMKKAGVPDDMAPRYLGLVKAHNRRA